MTNSPKYLYWDTDVFLSYFHRRPGRWPTLSALFAQIQQSDPRQKIVTSIITHTEAAYIEFDQETGFSLDDERKLDNFWADYSTVSFIELSIEVSRLARSLKRHAKEQGWRLKLADAFHLASAQWIKQFSSDGLIFHTYNLRDFQKFSPVVGFEICEPTVPQPFLLPE